MARSKDACVSWARIGLLLATLVLTACAVGRSSTPGPASEPAAAPPSQARPLVIYTGKEPASVAARALLASSISLRSTQRMFNPLPALLDAQSGPSLASRGLAMTLFSLRRLRSAS